MLSVFGGKITTFRKLSEHALEKLRPFFPAMRGRWTERAHLPGGDIADADFDAFLDTLRAAHPWLAPPLVKHYGRLDGTRAHTLLGGARSLSDLGIRFGPDFYEREAAFLMEHEWALTADDIVMRRTKHGLHMTDAEKETFAEWCDGRLAEAG